MANAARLGLDAIDISGQPIFADIIRSIEDASEDLDLAYFGSMQEEDDVVSGFFARDPFSALVWICRNVDRTKLLKNIREIYKMPIAQEASESGNEAVDEEEGNQTNPSSKRKRVARDKSTRQVNRELADKFTLDLVQRVASTQDLDTVKAPETLTVDQQRYRSFAKQHLGGMGLAVVSDLITYAEAVGSYDTMRDWQSIFSVWRRERQEQKELFHEIARAKAQARTQRARIEQSQSDPDRALEVASQQFLPEASTQEMADQKGLTAAQRQSFKYRYADAQKSRVDGLADDMRIRSKLDKLYEEYRALESRIRISDSGTGQRGITYDLVAKDHLFKVAFQSDQGVQVDRKRNADLWTEFTDNLNHAKKWNIIKRGFGTTGIFALFPRQMDANKWLEKKRVTEDHVNAWVRMVQTCNPDAITMAHKMEPLYQALVTDSAPPAEFYFLEHLGEQPVRRPLQLFDRYVQFYRISRNRRKFNFWFSLDGTQETDRIEEIEDTDFTE
jgi:hypothetical protein